jgi:beta-lactamase class A
MTRFLVALLLTVCVSMAASTAERSERFDVSYLWHRDLASVLAYRERVARVLGPTVTTSLGVVLAKNMYGLIYARAGDHTGAVDAARVHSVLLRARGLEPAAPVRATNWRFVNSPSPGKVASLVAQARPIAPAKRPAAPQSQIAGPKRQRSGPIRVHKAGTLEGAVERHIKALRRQGKVASDERTGWSVFDFTSGKKLVAINEDRPFQAASLIKPFIAAAYLERVNSGALKYGPRVRQHMERMIRVSDNRATNWLTRRVGGPRAVERLLKRRHPGVFRQTRIVEYIPANGRTYRNQASVHDYSRFLYALWKDGFPGAKELKRLMALPGPDRIVRNARKLPRSTRIYNKTGSTSRLCGDMGIVLFRDSAGREYPYTVIGVIEKRTRAKNYTQWIRSRGKVIGEVSDLVYAGIAKRHGI